jgi:hypothetical protein
MTADKQDNPVTADMPLYGDTETVAASGVPLPSLRVLQAAGAIQSQKMPKNHGGFRRMWPETEALKAAIASALGDHFAWNIRIVADAMAKTKNGVMSVVAESATIGLKKPKSKKATFIKASDLDYHLELIDRKFLFLKVPEVMTLVFPDVRHGQTDLLLGIVNKDGFLTIPWAFGSRHGRAQMKKGLGDDGYLTVERYYKLAMAAHGNFLSKATINISMQARMAWHHLHGHKAIFVQETVQLGKGDTDK